MGAGEARVQDHRYSFVVEASPDEVWRVFWGRRPRVSEHGAVRIEILHRGDAKGDGLIRHCEFPVPRYLLSGGRAHSWEWLTEVKPRESWRYDAVGKPLWSRASGWTRLEALGDGRTRVHFRETYHVFNPLLRWLLEARVHRFISKDNDRLMQAAVERGVEALRRARAGAGTASSRAGGSFSRTSRPPLAPPPRARSRLGGRSRPLRGRRRERPGRSRGSPRRLRLVPPGCYPGVVRPRREGIMGRASPPTSDASACRVSRFDRWVLRRLLDGLGRPELALVLWNGEELRPPEAEPRARIHLRDRRLVRELLANADLALGDGYAEGRVEVPGDLARAVEVVFRASDRAPRWARAAQRATAARRRRNTPQRARANVHRHYDLGNDFYALWLDERMVYTCAYFERPDAGLEEAQVAKLEHVCRKLRLRPGERVVEAGCGWGALALHMAAHHGVRVRAFNVSHEQTSYAREQAQRLGLADRVEFVEDDYRSIAGSFDAFVSVGMLEHVGRTHYDSLGRVVDRCLGPNGRGLLHFIGHAERWPMNAWLERRIFPGAYIPALSEALPVLEPHRLAVVDVEDLRRHYARTLEHWLERFEKSAERIEAMYDARFVRTWRLYLASSIAAFRSGTCQLFQVLFARRDDTSLPWTRADLYARAGAALGAH
jgi:cyclopropane-fatty-acyl-phospholipid synthase